MGRFGLCSGLDWNGMEVYCNEWDMRSSSHTTQYNMMPRYCLQHIPAGGGGLGAARFASRWSKRTSILTGRIMTRGCPSALATARAKDSHGAGQERAVGPVVTVVEIRSPQPLARIHSSLLGLRRCPVGGDSGSALHQTGRARLAVSRSSSRNYLTAPHPPLQPSSLRDRD